MFVTQGVRCAPDQIEQSLATRFNVGAVLDIVRRPILLSGRVVTLVRQCVERFKDKGVVLLFNRLTHFHPPNPRLLFRNAVLFFKARFETFQIYWNPRLRTFRSRPEILDRPRDWLVWFASRAQWPIRITQKLTRDNYGVRLFRPNNVLGLNWRSNHSHRAGHYSSFATNPFRKHRLVTGTYWNCRVRHIATRRTIDEIDAYLLQLVGKFD